LQVSIRRQLEKAVEFVRRQAELTRGGRGRDEDCSSPPAQSADPHYRVMALTDIKALPVGHLGHANSIVLLWSIAPMLAAGS